MNKLYNIENIVKEVLINEPITRSDNFILIYEVYRRINKIATRMPFNNVMMLHEEYKLPSFESITRARRKLQAKYEELKPVKRVQEVRKEEEAIYKEYASNS